MSRRTLGKISPPLPAMQFIATADASSDATIDFTGFDSTKYDAYLFVLANVIPVTDAVNFYVRTSTDGGTGYDSGASDYARNILTRDNADADDVLGTRGEAASQLQLDGVITIGSSANEDGFSGKLFVYGPHLVKTTTLTWEGMYRDSDGSVRTIIGSGIRDSAADVDALRFLMSSGNIESGTITMYGLRNR